MTDLEKLKSEFRKEVKYSSEYSAHLCPDKVLEYLDKIEKAQCNKIDLKDIINFDDDIINHFQCASLQDIMSFSKELLSRIGLSSRLLMTDLEKLKAVFDDIGLECIGNNDIDGVYLTVELVDNREMYINFKDGKFTHID